MSEKAIPEALRDLDKFLDTEYDQLQMGAVSEIESLAGYRESVISRSSVLAKDVDPRHLEPVLKKARRNQRLLVSLSDGVQAAMRKVSEIQNLSSGLGTYSMDGQRSSAMPVPQALSKRR